MKSIQYTKKLRHLDWLKENAKAYREHAERMRKDNFGVTISYIRYTIRGGVYQIDANPHLEIPARYIYGGLTDALDRIQKEIEDLETELKSVVVEL